MKFYRYHHGYANHVEDANGQYAKRKSVQALQRKHKRLQEAAQIFLDDYIKCVNSGDWGFWDPETQDIVINLRKALK